eukprot:6183605-Pleurochrysis_carterae.AAC.2
MPPPTAPARVQHDATSAAGGEPRRVTPILQCKSGAARLFQVAQRKWGLQRSLNRAKLARR